LRLLRPFLSSIRFDLEADDPVQFSRTLLTTTSERLGIDQTRAGQPAYFGPDLETDGFRVVAYGPDLQPLYRRNLTIKTIEKDHEWSENELTGQASTYMPRDFRVTSIAPLAKTATSYQLQPLSFDTEVIADDLHQPELSYYDEDGIFYVSWETQPGFSYYLEISPDQQEWSTRVVTDHVEEPVTYAFRSDDPAHDRRWLRLRVTRR
jgi:hypothetical protein